MFSIGRGTEQCLCTLFVAVKLCEHITSCCVWGVSCSVVEQGHRRASDVDKNGASGST